MLKKYQIIHKRKVRNQISFFGAIRNDWHHVSKLLESIYSVFWCASKEIVLIDDCSNSEQKELAHSLLLQNKKLTIIFNKSHQGIVPCLNLGIRKISGKLCLPVAADTHFVGRIFPIVMQYAFDWHRVDFFFAKTIHLEQDTMKKTGITGWAVNKGIQCRNSAVDNFISGKSRPSGSAVAFRTETLKKYRYDQKLGPLSDFYLNNLMLLKHKSYYYNKVISETYERKNSYSNMLAKEKALSLMNSALIKYASDDIYLSEKQQIRFNENEKKSGMMKE